MAKNVHAAQPQKSLNRDPRLRDVDDSVGGPVAPPKQMPPPRKLKV